MNVKEALAWAKQELNQAKVSEVDASALVLLGDVLELSRTQVLANDDLVLTKRQLNCYRKYIKRRKKHESVWNILGKVNFWGMELKVTFAVLVPRPETELLVQEALKEIKRPPLNRNSKFKIRNSISILDVGTGSGAIAIALAKELPNAKIDAVDISKKALKVAKENISLNEINNVTLIESDLFSNIIERYDIITANLPYIPTEDMASLSFDVHHYEPKNALDGGVGGLEIYERFISKVGEHLKPGGKVYCEIGINQGKRFSDICKKYLPGSKVIVNTDLAGIDRIAIIKTNKGNA